MNALRVGGFALVLASLVLSRGEAIAQPEAAGANVARREFLYTQSLLVKEKAVLRRALREPLLRDTQWFKSASASGLDNAEIALLDHLAVRVIPRTNLIEVAFETSRKQDTAPIVNSVVKVYLEWIRGQMTQETRGHLKILRSEEEKLKKSMRLRKEQLQELAKASSGIGFLKRKAEVISRRLAELSAEMAKVEIRLVIAHETLAAMRKQQAKGLLGLTPEEEAAVEADGVIQKLEYDRLRLKVGRKGMLTSVKESDPAVKRLDAQLAEIVTLLNQRRDALRKRAIRIRMAVANRSRDTARDCLKALASKIADTQAEGAIQNGMVGAMKVAEAEYLGVRRMYRQISHQRREIEMMQYHSDKPSIDRVSEAMAPIRPTASGKWRASAKILITGTLKRDAPSGRCKWEHRRRRHVRGYNHPE